MKSQQTPINGRPKRRPQLPTAAADAVLAFEERVIWRSEDAARSAGGAARRGLDRALWNLQRRLIWPAQDRARELSGPSRVLTASGLALLAVVAGVAGVLWASSGSSGGAAPTRVAATTAETHVTAQAPTHEEKPAPTLHGAAPVFKPTKAPKPSAGSKSPAAKPSTASTSAATSGSATATAGSGSGSAATGTISSSPAASTSAAEATAPNGAPAGPEAIAVAREFAGAFVAYETGGTEAKVRGAFRSTATRELARSLLRRPPKQPATTKVPKAKVVNVVAGPSLGKVYPVSVSLLRVGVTSELRLEMEQTKRHRWQVTNVLG